MDESGIVELFRSEMFLRLLNQQIARHAIEPGRPGSEQDIASAKLLATELVNDLHQELSTVVEYSLRSAFEEQLQQVTSDLRRMQREIDDLGDRMKRAPLGSLAPQPSQPVLSACREGDMESFEQELEFEKNRLEQNNRQKVELHNVKQQIKAIRNSLLKFSVATSSDVSQQENIALHKETNQRLSQLADDLQNLQLQPPTSENLENSFSMTADNRFYALERQVRQLRDVVESRDRVQASMNEKYESTDDVIAASFKSVWNVVTMMEGGLAEMRKQMQEKLDSLAIKQEKEKSLIHSFFK